MKSFGALSLVRPLAIALGVVLVASLAVVSSGAFGQFTATGRGDVRVGAGGVALSWDHSTTSQADMVVGPLQPAGSMQFGLDLVNSGDLGLSAIQLAVQGTNTGSVSDGLQLAIDSCSIPWSGETPNLICGGEERVVSVDRPVAGVIGLPNSGALITDGVDHLRFTFRLPRSAPASMMNSSGTVSILATGVQRVGEKR